MAPTKRKRTHDQSAPINLDGYFGLAFSCLIASPTTAAVLTTELSTEFSGGADPEGIPPWVTINIDDEGTAGSAYMTITNNGLTGSEFISQMYFNFTPSLDVDDLDFSVVDTEGRFRSPSIKTDEDRWNVAGSGLYDIEFKFKTSSRDRFEAGESIRFLIRGPQSMTAESFNVNSTGGDNGSYRIAAHVQSIGQRGDLSGWVGNYTVPEPATITLLTIGGATMLLRKRRRAALSK
jgi:hypothetical protein